MKKRIVEISPSVCIWNYALTSDEISQLLKDSVSENVWHHVVVIKNESGVLVYVNRDKC